LTLVQDVEVHSAEATVPTRWVVESLSQIAQHQDPLAELQVMLDVVLNYKKGKTVRHYFYVLFTVCWQELTSLQLAASDITLERLAALFNLSFESSI